MIMFWVAVLADQHSALRAARRLRSRRRHPLRRTRAAKREARRHDERHRADLGRQRDLARRDRRRALGRLSDRLCDASVRLLSAAAAHAGGADPARRRIRIPAQDRALALDLGRELRRRLARRRLHAGPDRRRAGRGSCRSPMATMSAATSVGSAPSRCSAASACASATRCSAPAGSSANARATSATPPIG